eukprot:PhM_4_TR3798/c0_g1_i1/m.25859/K09648/IMP2; mitochondrial inner membrane protease subunit 2
MRTHSFQSVLYEVRYIIAGYLVGKALATQVSFCRVVGDSMLPTLRQDTNDVVFLSTWSARHRPITRGAVYVLWHPSRQYKVIKRIIGLPGDRVPTSGIVNSGDPDAVDVEVPTGYVWVEGDNYFASEDSRHYGAVPMASVQGAALAVVWPPQRLSFLPTRDVVLGPRTTQGATSSSDETNSNNINKVDKTSNNNSSGDVPFSIVSPAERRSRLVDLIDVGVVAQARSPQAAAAASASSTDDTKGAPDGDEAPVKQ